MSGFFKFIVFLFSISLLISCGKKDNETTTTPDETKAEVVKNATPVEQGKPAWVPKKRYAKAANPVEARIFQWQDSIHKATYDERINLKAMEEVIKAMKEHGVKYTESEISGSYLLRAADYSQGLRDFDGALDILSILLKKYKGSVEYSDALYYTGYIYDRQKEDYPKAKELYDRFLKEQPVHDLVPQVKEFLAEVEIKLAAKK